MRDHATILREAGIEKVQRATSVESVNTVRAWFQRGRIPDEHWKAFADARLASLKELATAVAKRAA